MSKDRVTGSPTSWRRRRLISTSRRRPPQLCGRLSWRYAKCVRLAAAVQTTSTPTEHVQTRRPARSRRRRANISHARQVPRSHVLLSACRRAIKKLGYSLLGHERNQQNDGRKARSNAKLKPMSRACAIYQNIRPFGVKNSCTADT